MHYHFSMDIEENCKLICGDVGGNVRVLLFSPVLRGPFKNEPGRGLTTLRHVDLQRRVIMITKKYFLLQTLMVPLHHGAYAHREFLSQKCVMLQILNHYYCSKIPWYYTLILFSATFASRDAPGRTASHTQGVGAAGVVLRVAALRGILCHLP